MCVPVNVGELDTSRVTVDRSAEGNVGGPSAFRVMLENSGLAVELEKASVPVVLVTQLATWVPSTVTVQFKIPACATTAGSASARAVVAASKVLDMIRVSMVGERVNTKQVFAMQPSPRSCNISPTPFGMTRRALGALEGRDAPLRPRRGVGLGDHQPRPGPGAQMENGMAAVPININAVIIDYYGRTIMGPIKIVGELSRTDLGVGGGPIVPEPPPDGGDGKPPIDPGLHPEHPIVIPTPPPGTTPPVQPGDPVTPVPPPAGAAGWPVQPVVPPDYIIVNFPGIGPVYVPRPASSAG